MLRQVQQLKSVWFCLFKVFVVSTIFNLQGKTMLRGVQQLKSVWFSLFKVFVVSRQFSIYKEQLSLKESNN